MPAENVERLPARAVPRTKQRAGGEAERSQKEEEEGEFEAVFVDPAGEEDAVRLSSEDRKLDI